jgi:hypothetical protein
VFYASPHAGAALYEVMYIHHVRQHMTGHGKEMDIVRDIVLLACTAGQL